MQTDILTAVTARIAALRDAAPGRPVLVGLDGSVAAGKSTAAAHIASALRAHGLTTAVVSADGFLRTADQLRADGLAARKGFPESFDRDAMRAFLTAAQAGLSPTAPRYSHADYDISQTETQSAAGDVLLFEGVNVLGADLAPLYDLRLYLDTPEAIARGRFLDRFAATPFMPVRVDALAPWRPADGDPTRWGEAVWAAINEMNLRKHISAGRDRADMLIS